MHVEIFAIILCFFNDCLFCISCNMYFNYRLQGIGNVSCFVPDPSTTMPTQVRASAILKIKYMYRVVNGSS